MGLAPGKFCSEECLNSDKLRVRKANYKCQDINKKRRKVIRGEKKKKGDKLVAKEGETYASGAF
jgi:hypothetical protein